MDRSQETIAVPAGQMGQPLKPQEKAYHPVGVQAADPSKPEEALRDDFIYLLCCAFTCCNCDFPKCFGTRSECTCLWCENSSICCKVVDDQKACCVFYSGHNETVIPRTLYSEYSQICCWECYASLPCVDGPFKKIHDRPNHVTENFTLASEAMVCTGCICCMSGYNCNSDLIMSLRISLLRVRRWCALAAFAACLATTATALLAWALTPSRFACAARVRVSSTSPSAATLDTLTPTLAASTTRATRPVLCLTHAARPFLNATASTPAAPPLRRGGACDPRALRRHFVCGLEVQCLLLQGPHRQNYVTENFTLASDVVVCTGCICCMSGYNCNFPSCLGSYNKSVHCCCESESIFTKPICCDPGYKNPDTCCINYKGHQACVMPYTCCKTISQCCCTDTRYALPCDEEVPAILALCACTMCVDWKCNVSCCKDLNTLMGRKIVTYVDNSAAQNPAMQQQQNPAYNGGTVQAKPI
eukprot:CAMPEP_0185015806 /NCGR_PEP_ID=MMETSP1098-20130426/100022_1 /TAXON_ID=89044 /ORGANISM="Spumella elongata, Strain CCAP 955/1" /LENGTH=473 /DNA_ID=CAMNT_0027544947 /DNA_START=41 /DNA_END=1463 /DNA_ORIENTATION=-